MDLERMMADLAALKARSNKLSKEMREMADIATEMDAQRKRLETEEREALEAQAHLVEADYRAAHPDAKAITCICSYPVHQQTGKGILMVGPLDRDSAIKAVKAIGRSGVDGSGVFMNSEADVSAALRKCAVYPTDVADINEMLLHSFPFCASAVREAASLSGAWAKVTSGKSES